MGIRNIIIRWSIRDIARTQSKLFQFTRHNDPNVLERDIAPLLFMRRMGSGILPKKQQGRIDVYTQVHGLPTTLRQTCHAIAVVEFKIDPLDRENVAFLTEIIDKELDKLGYIEG